MRVAPFAVVLALAVLTIARATPGAAPAGIDLRADTNHDGLVDVAGDSDELAAAAGGRGIFLANIDDDQRRCPKRGPRGEELSDRALAACHDAADTVVNGPADLIDLARLKTVPWPEAAEGATAVVSVSRPAASFVRIFVRREESFVPLGRGALSAPELRAGVELAIEGKDIIRDRRVWDGSATVTVRVSGSGGETSDAVDMRVAPVLLQHDLQPVERVFAQPLDEGEFRRGIEQVLDDFQTTARPLVPILTAFSNLNLRLLREGSPPFVASLRRALDAAGIDAPITVPGVADPWAQDYFEPAYASMPAAGGRQHVMRVLIRSANVYNPKSATQPLRAAGRFLFTRMRGRDVAAVQQFDLESPRPIAAQFNSTGNLPTIPPYAYLADTLNSGGNFSTIPPYTHDGRAYPNGRILIGGRPGYRPDPSFLRMLEAQGAQKPLYIDTSWLQAGHVDEVVSFVKAPSARGWAMVVLDPRLGVQLLRQARAEGRGNAAMFVGRKGIGVDEKEQLRLVHATVTVNQVLDGGGVVRASLRAAARIDEAVARIKRATGLTDSEIVRVAGLHDRDPSGTMTRLSGWLQRPGADSFAYVPSIVNGLPLSDRAFAAADPHGPVVDGRDVFKRQAEHAFGRVGVRVHWVEDFQYLHLNGGEVHCGTNVLRAVGTGTPWWAARAERDSAVEGA
jgi:protein-arginine deiminase